MVIEYEEDRVVRESPPTKRRRIDNKSEQPQQPGGDKPKEASATVH